MPRMLIWITAVILLSVPCWADDPTRLPIPADFEIEADSWFGVYAQKTKVGHAHMTVGPVEGSPGIIRATMEAEINAVAMGQKMSLEIFEQMDFSNEGGRPLVAAAAKMVQNDQGMKVTLGREDGKYVASVDAGGAPRRMELEDLDYTLEDFLTVELWIRNGPELGQEVSVRSFSLDDLETDIETYALEKEERALVDGVALTYYEFSASSEKNGSLGTLRTDAAGRWISAVIGGFLELRAEPESLAKDYDYSADIFVMGMASVDRDLGDPRKITKLVLRTDSTTRIPSHGRQSSTTENGKTTLTIGVGEHAEATAEEIADALRETVDYPIADPKIAALAKSAIGEATSDRDKVHALVAFVDKFIEDDYAAQPLTITHILEQKRGDCTEHSLLFTTLARSLGIPARDISGLVYMGDEFKAFGGHAWSEVALDGRWVPIDATWGEVEINATHIRFGHEDQTSGMGAFAGYQFELVEVEPAVVVEPSPTENAPTHSITEESLAPLAAKVLSVAAAQKMFEEKLPTIRLGTATEIEKHLSEELLAQFKNWYDEDIARTEAESNAWLLSQALLAKYVFETNEILVCADNIANLVHMAGVPQLLSDSALSAILTHEVVHASDENRYGLFKTATSIQSVAESTPFNAVIEGHAQFVARRICKEQGWTEGFEAFVSVIGTVPGADQLDEAVRYMLRNFAVAEAAAYKDGERFIAALHEAGGQEAIDRAFKSPPKEMTLIYHPDWYLDPASRPEYEFNVVEGLGSFRSKYPEEQWIHTLTGVTRPQLEVAFSLLPPEEVKGILDALKQCHVAIIQPKVAPESKMITAALFELESAEDARRFMGLEEKLLHLKDKTMTSGAIRIKDSKTTDLSGKGWVGIESNKTVVAGFETVQVLTVIAVHEHLGVEASFTNYEISKEELQAQVQLLFDGALSTVKKEE